MEYLIAVFSDFDRAGLWWLGFRLLHRTISEKDKTEPDKCRMFWFGSE
jgi:hypothetical protein